MNIYKNRILCTSREIAKARTELAVAADRLDCSVEDTQQMQKEIVDILSKYMNLDREILKIRMNIVYEVKRGIRDVKTIQIK